MTGRDRAPGKDSRPFSIHDASSRDLYPSGTGQEEAPRYVAVRDPFDVWVIWDVQSNLPVMQAGTPLTAAPKEIERMVALLHRQDHPDVP